MSWRADIFESRREPIDRAGFSHQVESLAVAARPKLAYATLHSEKTASRKKLDFTSHYCYFLSLKGGPSLTSTTADGRTGYAQATTFVYYAKS